MVSARGVLRSPSFWIAAGFAGRHLVGAHHLRRNLAWLAQTTVAAEQVALPVVHFVIPVLAEQDHIEPALRWFGDLLEQLQGSTLTFATTAREETDRDALLRQLEGRTGREITPKAFPALTASQLKGLRESAYTNGGRLPAEMARKVLATDPLTPEVVARLAAGARKRGLTVHHTHYTGPGRKAAQVNQAVAMLPDAADSDYLAVYDIDSRPTLDLFERTAALIAERTRRDGRAPQVVQQSARFAVPSGAPDTWETALCRASAHVQTLWTLRREITSFRRYARAVRTPTGVPAFDAVRRGLAQTVGHGLLVQLPAFRAVGGLPEDTLLDDLPFGYRLTAAGIPVDCVPATATADAPHDVRELIAQGKRWFHNYFDYPVVARAARRAGHGSSAEHVVALSTAAYRGVTWAASGPLTAAVTAILIAPKTPWPVRMLAAAGLWAATVPPAKALAREQGHPAPAAELASRSAALYAAYLMRSTGPLLAIAAKASRRTPAGSSPKTARRLTKEH